MNKMKGIALVILSAVIFGITPTMAKYTYTHGSNPVMMTMFRSLLPIPIILAFLLFKKIPIKIPAKTLGKISIIALIGSTVTSVMLNMSYNYIPVGMSTTLHFVYPTFVSIYTFLYGAMTNQVTFDLTPLSWLYTFIVAVSVSVGANAFLQVGIRYTGASTSAILSMFEPITSVVCGVLILNESLSGVKLLGCALILFAVYLLTRKRTVIE